MPELPEVETVRRGIIPFAEQQKIVYVEVRNRQFRRKIPLDFEQNIQNKNILEISRRSKYLIFNLNQGFVILHLGMSGVLLVVDKKTKIKKHDHLDFILSNNKILRLNDPRRFGCVIYTQENPLQHSLLIKLAPEPLSGKFNFEYLKKVLKNRKTNIKTALMNSHLVVGVGNIYASEVLFKSKIHPLTLACDLTYEEIEILLISIKKVLKKSIKLGGTTLKDFFGADGKPGYFAQQLLVYGRENEDCEICQNKIQKIVIANRASYFCSSCQLI